MPLLRRAYQPQPAGAPAAPLSTPAADPRRGVLAGTVAAVRRAPEIGGLVAIAALLNLWALGRNGWANDYYAAAVRSMESSWHDFLYASMDPSGVMTVDKPPLALWVQALSARVFGYHPLSILVPQALMGVACVLIVYDLVRRRFGRVGGTIAGLALATTPIAVAMARHNNPDELLTLCCLAAVWFAVRALEDGRTRWLVLAGVAVGLGFETKMLIAFAVVPGIGLAYLVASPRGPARAIRQLLAGGAAMFATAAAWPLLVMLTPAADRPYVSGTSDNSILSLIFGYNGLGRVTGQEGGPNNLGVTPTFGQGTGVFRLFNQTMAGQDGWLLAAAIAGAAAILMASRARRREPRTTWVIAVGGAFLVTAAVFSFAQGIFHPYYVVLLAPFTAALVGAGGATAIASGRLAALAGVAILAAGVIGELVVLGDYPGQLPWLDVVLPLVCGAAAIALLAARDARTRAAALAIALAALLIAPAIWSVDTLGYRTATTFPSGGPQDVASTPGGFGGFRAFGSRTFAGGGPPRLGLPGRRSRFFPAPGTTPPPFAQRRFLPGGVGAFGANAISSDVLAYVRSHGGGTIAVSSQSTAASEIVSADVRIAGIGGFTGRESDPSVAWLATEVAKGSIRWVIVDPTASTRGGGFAFGGAGSPFGGSSFQPRVSDPRTGASTALAAAQQACTPVSGVANLYDCAGRAQALLGV